MLEATDGAAVTFDPPLENLKTLAAKQCAKHVGFNGPCAIVRFLNTVKRQQKGAGADTPSEIDVHHNILYDLFEPPPLSLLLFLRENGSQQVLDILFPKQEGFASGDGTRPCIPQRSRTPSRRGSRDDVAGMDPHSTQPPFLRSSLAWVLLGATVATAAPPAWPPSVRSRPRCGAGLPSTQMVLEHLDPKSSYGEH